MAIWGSRVSRRRCRGLAVADAPPRLLQQHLKGGWQRLWARPRFPQAAAAIHSGKAPAAAARPGATLVGQPRYGPQKSYELRARRIRCCGGLRGPLPHVRVGSATSSPSRAQE